MTFNIIFHVDGYVDGILTLIDNKMYWIHENHKENINLNNFKTYYTNQDLICTEEEYNRALFYMELLGY